MAKRPAKDEDDRVATSVRFPPEILIALKTMSVRERTPVNTIINEAVRVVLTRKGYIQREAVA
jgi:hypothetical protein